jgi:hypothetical protein
MMKKRKKRRNNSIVIMNNALRKKLLVMMDEDQSMCKTKWDINTHKKHIRKFKQIILVFGWPGYDLVGKDGAKAAWLIAQHSDEDLEFQKRCLGLMMQAVKQNQASPEDLAYLKDRIAKNSRTRQSYGTQFYTDSHGNYRSWPIKDLKNIEARRKKLGMQSFKEYKRYMLNRYLAITHN